MVEIVVLGEEFDPADFTIELGIEPNRTWHKGDVIGSSILRRKTHGWELNSGFQTEWIVEKILIQMLDKLTGKVQKLRSYCAAHHLKVQVCCVTEIRDAPTPTLDFSPEVLGRLADLGASFWIDYYCLGDCQ